MSPSDREKKKAAPAPPLPAGWGVSPEPASLRAVLDHSPDPQYVLDQETERFLYVNPALERMVEYAPGEIVALGISPDLLMAPEEVEEARAQFRARSDKSQDRYPFTALTKTGKRIPVEAFVHRLDIGGRRVAIGAVREISEQKALEKRLREQVDLQRNQTLGAYQSNVRIYQLTEKIRAAYESTQDILKCRSMDELSESVIRILRDPNGLNYRVARFYHVEGRKLRMLSASDEKRRKVIDMRKSHRLARVVRGEIKPEAIPDWKVIPLRMRDEVIGLVLTVREEDDRARVWQENIVMTMVGLISLMIDNLTLYQKVKAQTITDPLTRVFNRRHFDEKLAAELGRAVRYKRDLSLAMIDIDNFKSINDAHGHQQGDAILKGLAKILGSWTRSTDLVFRYGGEEFSLLLPETSLENAFAKAEHLRTLVEMHPFTNLSDPGSPFRIAISLGVSAVNPAVATPEALIRSADKALYQSKRSGKNRTTIAADVKPV